MNNLSVNYKNQSVEFKFMVTNRDVVTNSNLRQDIERYGIAQDLIVIPTEEYEDELSDHIGYKFGLGESVGSYVVLDGQHRLTCLNDILNKIAKIEADNASIKDEKKKKTVPTLASSEIPLKVVNTEYLKRFGGVDNYVIMLNNTSKKWSNKDFIVNAYQRNEESFELRVIKKFTDGKMSISTISRWLCGNTKVVNSKSLQKLVTGENIGVDCIKAMKLYLMLKTLGFSTEFLNKRYMIDAYNDLKKGDNEAKALFKLSKIKSVESISKANYAEGDVLTKIKSIINSDYDMWRNESNISAAQENEAIKSANVLNVITEKDIEDFLNDTTEGKIEEAKTKAVA